MDYLGRLSMIDLSDEEWLQVADDMKSLLEYVDKLQELDTTHVEPLSHVLPLKNAFREDIVTNGDEREQMLGNAPARKSGMFVVPGTLKQ